MEGNAGGDGAAPEGWEQIAAGGVVGGADENDFGVCVMKMMIKKWGDAVPVS